MKQHTILAILPFVLAFGSGCSGDSDPADATGGTSNGATGGSSSGTGGTTGGSAGSSSGATGGASCATDLVANPVNNYAFSSTLTFPPIAVMPRAELSFDWSAVTTDFLDHDVDPATDVVAVNVMLWTLTQADLETRLNDDTLAQRNLAVGARYDTMGATSANLFDFVTFANEPVSEEMFLPFLDATGYPPDLNTYTVMIATESAPGEGTRMIQAFRLDPESTNTTVTLTNESTELEYTVDLLSHQHTPVPAGQGAITIDWTDMDGLPNALGNEFWATYITEALVARYDETPAELEASFLDLELIAEEMYRAEITSGTSADLSTFTNEGGQAFAGIDATSTWVLALVCGGCRNPAPWYLTLLTPCQ